MRSLTALALALLACSQIRNPDERYDGGALSDAAAGADGGPCLAPRTVCGASCVNTNVDGRNCGACNAVCAMGQRCVSGRCAPLSLPSCPGAERGCEVLSVLGGTWAMGEAGTMGAGPVQPSITVGDFEADAFEVTVRRFRRWWSAGHPDMAMVMYPSGVPPMPTAPLAEPTQTGADMRCNWTAAPGAREEHPINCVDWNTAMAFCAWDQGRLPTEAEWEYLARGRAAPEGAAPRRYPWGEAEPALSGACDRAQWRNCMGEGGGITKPVGSFPSGVIGGALDLAGNVGEWTADVALPYTDGMCWGGASRANPLCLGMSPNRMARGVPQYLNGMDAATADSLRGAARSPGGFPATERREFVGLRCVRDRR